MKDTTDYTPSSYPTCATFAVDAIFQIPKHSQIVVCQRYKKTGETCEVRLFRGDSDVVRISYADPCHYTAELDFYLESGLMCMEEGFSGLRAIDVMMLESIYFKSMELMSMTRAPKGTTFQRASHSSLKKGGGPL